MWTNQVSWTKYFSPTIKDILDGSQQRFFQLYLKNVRDYFRQTGIVLWLLNTFQSALNKHPCRTGLKAFSSQAIAETASSLVNLSAIQFFDATSFRECIVIAKQRNHMSENRLAALARVEQSRLNKYCHNKILSLRISEYLRNSLWLSSTDWFCFGRNKVQSQTTTSI